MRLDRRPRMITASVLVTTSLLVLYPQGTLRAAENPAPVLLRSIDSPEVRIGRPFDQRNAANKVDVGLLAADGTPVRFAPQSAAPEVVVDKYSVWGLIPPLIVGLLLVWLYVTRKTNILRDSTLCAERYFRAQMVDFREKRRDECVLRRGLIAEMMTNNIHDPTTRLNDVLNEKDEKKQEERSQKLATDLATGGIENAGRKLAEVYTQYSENKRRAARLVNEMKEAGISKPPDPFDDANGFEAMIDAVQIKARLPPYSLGRLQMAWWFLIVIGGVTLMYVATGKLFKIPESVLWLIGISVTTAGIGYAIDNRQPPSKLPPKSQFCLEDMLTDMQGGDTFYRWQMLVITLLLGVVFIVELVRNFVMTDFDLTLLSLMGISAGTYLGFKWPERSPTIPGPPVQQ